jgi:hypothetical protein
MEAGCLLTILAMLVVALIVVQQVVLTVLQVIVALYPYPIRQSCCEVVEVARENETVVNGFSQTN